MDLCHKKFDAVLMNPPFGDSTVASKTLVDRRDLRGSKMIYVQPSLSRVSTGLSTRRSRCYYLSLRLLSFLSPKMARRGASGRSPTDVFADLGSGVLDTAMVETAAFCLLKGDSRATTTYYRLLEAVDEEGMLSRACDTESVNPPRSST